MYTHHTLQAFHDSIIKLVEKEVDFARLSLRPSDVEWMNGLLSLVRTVAYPKPLAAPAEQIRLTDDTIDQAAGAILAKVPPGYGMTRAEARTYAREAIGKGGVAILMPSSAGIAAYDYDRHTVTLRFDSDDDVMAVVRMFPGRGQLVQQPSEPSPSEPEPV